MYYILLFLLLFLSSCGTLRNRGRAADKAATELEDPLTYGERRKFDYYYLEAVRMKQKGD